ncbi:hypothetical protein [Burkholderia stagnalis]|uniref:hypothetical protein n=1 Tax=Burkholderia stagnalis TaxID=1503054 RepID=UPI000F5BB9C7|nr:hypothetical protein [Burkholderia stagnalis]RQP98873.1 hypothetical protein DF164_31200 [Burkholderia stagnalis]RQY64925.1 hypothetical protein DF110_30725 [Burkholderia stagnalis]
MLELSRFQMLRPAQRISEEEKGQLGLPLYGSQPLSPLADQLIASDSTDKYASLVERYAERNKGGDLVTNTPPDADLMTLYSWLGFKAQPIRKNDLKSFLQNWAPKFSLQLAKEWMRIADNYVVSLLDATLDLGCQYDFQLLIRALYVYALCLEVAKDRASITLSSAASDALLARIMIAPIVIPPLLIRDRCTRKCREATTRIDQSAAVADLQRPDPKCNCECDRNCHKPSGYCICIRPYVADLYIIKEELARYEAGEIADIENIIAGETKVRHHRFLSRSEQTNETDAETQTSEERDHQVDEKSALQSEVKKTVDDKVNVDAGVTATLKYGNSITITPHANVTYNNAKSLASSQARSYAKDVVDRSVTSLQTKTRTVAISKILTESEERNKDSINNSFPGSDHRAGIFYWVNKVSHAQVFNYGKHMMFDMIVPEPAALFKALYDSKMTKDQTAQQPPKPDIDISGITPDSYGGLLNQYAISTTDDITPPNAEVVVSIAVAQNLAKPDDGKTMAFSSTDAKVDIPDGYAAAAADFDLRCSCGDPGSTDPDDEVAFSINLGNHCLLAKSMDEWRDGSQKGKTTPWSATDSVQMLGETGTLAVAVAGFSSLAISLSGSISIRCELTPSARAAWQTHIYNLIMADYGRKLAAYQSATGQTTDFVQIKGRNPFLNREIERNEFKRHIIAILLCNYFNGIGSMVDHVTPCGYPEFDFAKLSADMPIVQFFEQVFEWNYMTYLFYHSMWARKCKWPELIDADSGDPLFDKFLMSGAARVQVPITPGMEHVFLWFLKRNEIWGESGEPPLPGDNDYISMIQEMKEADQCDYSDRPGLIAAQKDSNKLQLTGSSFYWDVANDQLSTLTIANDIDREILVDYKVYRIISIEDVGAADHMSWTLTIDPPFVDPDAVNLKHAVGAVFVGAPWEIIVPTELVYLRNKTDTLPVYPLS